MPAFFDRSKLAKEPEVPKRNTEEFKALVGRNKDLDINSFASSVFSFPTSYSLLQKHGGIRCLERLYNEDDLIAGDVDTRLEAVINSMIKIEAEDEQTEQFVRDNLEPHLLDLVESIWWAVPYGYSVTELVWTDPRTNNGLFEIDKVIKRKYYNFEPLFDLKSVLVTSGFGSSLTKVAPFGKYLLTVNKGCPEQPWGQPLFLKLFWPFIFRCQGYTFWAKFLERFGQPFLHGKTDRQKVKDLMELLDSVKDASAIATDMETEVKAIDMAGSNGQQFKLFDDAIRGRIHHAILGQNLTAEVSSGSLAAARVHDGVRKDKVKADLRMVEQSLNKLTKILLFFNKKDPESAKVSLEVDRGLNINRAERDKLLMDSGQVKLTEQYFRKNYDFEDGDFELSQPGPFSINAGVSNSPTNLSNGGGLAGYRINGCDQHSKVDFAPQKLTPEQQELEDMINLILGSGVSAFQADDLLAAIKASSNQGDLVRSLSSLAQDDNPDFDQMMTKALYWALSRGAVNASS